MGLVDPCQPLTMGGVTPLVFTDETTDLRPVECRGESLHVRHISRILPGGGHSPAGGKGSLLARRQKLAARSSSES